MKGLQNKEEFNDFTACIASSSELVGFLREREDENFDEMLDVIDDSGYESDAYIRDIIVIKQLFAEIYAAINENY